MKELADVAAAGAAALFALYLTGDSMVAIPVESVPDRIAGDASPDCVAGELDAVVACPLVGDVAGP